MPSLLTERIESLKAGAIAATAFILAEVSLIGGKTWLFPPEIFTADLYFQWLLLAGIAATSGFLFGVTYRYIIRNDRNSHLQDGAVLAFGLVRGLALVEATPLDLAQFWSLSLAIGQSLACFAIARLSLDLAIARQWIKPFS